MAQTAFIAKHGLIVGQNEIVDTAGNLTVPGDITIDGEIVRSGAASQYATENFVATSITTAVSNLVDTAPTTLDTLNELAAALGDDPNFATTTAAAIGLKANSADLATVATSGSYTDLSNTPTLGTAAATDSTAYATAAQGALADSALQTVAFADLTSTPTTIAGYGITDAFDGAYSSLTGTPTLATVATSGSYTDLSNTPTIPADVGDLTDTGSLLGAVNDGAVTEAKLDPTLNSQLARKGTAIALSIALG